MDKKTYDSKIRILYDIYNIYYSFLVNAKPKNREEFVNIIKALEQNINDSMDELGESDCQE